MFLLDRYLEQRALGFANHIRERRGLPHANRMERGMLRRSSECPMTRTIGPGVWTCPRQLIIGGNESGDFLVGGAYHRLPWAVRLFVRRFDKGKFPHLRTTRPMVRGIDHLDFKAVDERVAA